MTSEEIKNILDDLDDDQLSTFQWFLQQPNNVQGLPAIKKSQLQTPNRCITVTVMVETYGLQRAVQVTRVVLEKMSMNDLLQRFPASSSGPEGVSEVQMEPADTEPEPKRMKISSVFTPEMQMESKQISYSFKCSGAGKFHCAETGLVFETKQGVELQYSIVQWDESRLRPTGKEAAGPLFNIYCSEEAAVRQLYFPHCETKDALRTDHLLSVANSTDDKMNILEPLQITDTHVVMEVTQRSLFSLIWGPVKKWFSTPVKGQVLLFLRSPKGGPPRLSVFLLQKSVPPSQVAAQQRDAEYIEIPADCLFSFGRSYSLRCEQEGLIIQPECEKFRSCFGPDFHPTFEVFLTTNPDAVTLIIQDQEGTDVWKRDVLLKDPRRDTEQRVQPQIVLPEDWLQPLWTQLIDRLSYVNVNQILDILYQQRVFNAQEKNVIRAQIGADKARQLIEGIQQKGPDAVSVLKAALCEVDPFLCRNLNLL